MTIKEALKIVDSWEKLPPAEIAMNFYAAIKGYEHSKGFIEGWNARGQKDAELMFQGTAEQGFYPMGPGKLKEEILKLNVGEGE